MRVVAAALAALVFLHVNGIEALPGPDGLERVTLDLAAGDMPKQEVIAWMRTAIAGAA